MESSTGSQKKAWESPVVDTLELGETLGGIRGGFTESLFDGRGRLAESTYGTIPNG